MEQVKKHYFWILMAIIIIGSLGIWFMATGSMVTDYNARKSTLDGLFQNIQQIFNKHDHPNQLLIDEIGNETKKLVDDYMAAWEKLYEQQQANNLLPEALNDDFKKDFPDALATGQLAQHHREHYQNFIKRHYEKLLYEDLRVRKTSTLGSGRPSRQGMTGAPGEEEEEVDTGVIEWAQPEIYKISAGWRTAPSIAVIEKAQEDLWVFEALIKIITDINAAATTIEDAGIQQIKVMEIGGDAIESAQSDSSEIITLASAEQAPGEQAPTQPMTGGADSQGADVKPRYIDKDGNPIADPKNPPEGHATEYNLMPIHLTLVMDPLRIPELLAGCGNSAMPIEVTDVRFEHEAGSDPVDFNALVEWAKGGLVAAAKPDFMQDRQMNNRGPTRGNIRPSRAGGRDVVQVTGKTVELRGVIRIFKKPVPPEGFEPPEPEPTDETVEPGDATTTDDGTDPTDDATDTPPATDESTTEPAVDPAADDATDTPATPGPAAPAPAVGGGA